MIVARASNLDERYQLSRGGGEEPMWTATGDEIIYRNQRRWYSVPVLHSAGIPFGAARLLFEGPYSNVPGWSHAVTPDGKRFMLLLASSEETATKLHVVTGWFSELNRLAPGDR